MAKLVEMVDEYEKRLQEMPFVPRVSYGHRMLPGDGGPNRDFLSTFPAILALLCSF